MRLVVVVLPCAAGDRDGIAEAHQLAEHLRARHHGDARIERRFDFRVVARHRAGDHHDVRAGDIGRGMADADARAEAA